MKDQVKTVLAFALLGVLAYAIYTQMSGLALVPAFDVEPAPNEPDISKLEDLSEVASVETVPLLGGNSTYDLGGRNLFQYGKPKPPPPTAAEIEARRLAEEARLKAMEEEAKRRADEQRKLQEEQERRAREQMEALAKMREREKTTQENRPPPPKPPPPINLKLVGWLGKPNSRIAVFLRGEEIVLAGQGEVIEGKFRVLSLGPESVTMGYTDPDHADATKVLAMGT